MTDWVHFISEPRDKLFTQLTLYYVTIAVVFLWLPTVIPMGEFVTKTASAVGAIPVDTKNLADYLSNESGTAWTQRLNWLSLVWSSISVFLLSLPITWVYRGTRRPDQTLQSVIETVMILPVVTVGIIMMVQDSLPLAFSLGGIFAGVQFRSRLRQIADTHYIFASIGLGIACGIGALDFAYVMSICFCFAVYALWHANYAQDASKPHMTRRSEQRFAPEPIDDGEAEQDSEPTKRD
jgi:hypothetical protein